MSERNFKIIKNGDKPEPKSDAEYIESHKLSLLHLLIKENPDRAREIISKIAESKRMEAA